MTAGDAIKAMESDPQWLAKRDERERIRQERADEFSKAEVPLVTALANAGVPVTSVWDLVNTSEPYPRAIPVLLSHLDRRYPDEIRAGIARALAVIEARPHRRTILDAYESTDGAVMRHTKDGLALAVSATADFDDVVRLLLDQTHGGSRILLLGSLKRSKDPRAEAVIAELAVVPLFSKEIGSWRRKRI